MRYSDGQVRIPETVKGFHRRYSGCYDPAGPLLEQGLACDCTRAVEGLEDGLWSIQFWWEDALGGREGEKPHV